MTHRRRIWQAIADTCVTMNEEKLEELIDRIVRTQTENEVRLAIRAQAYRKALARIYMAFPDGVYQIVNEEMKKLPPTLADEVKEETRKLPFPVKPEVACGQ